VGKRSLSIGVSSLDGDVQPRMDSEAFLNVECSAKF